MQHAPHVAGSLSLSIYRSDKGFGYALWINPSGGKKTETRRGNGRTVEERKCWEGNRDVGINAIGNLKASDAWRP